MFQRIIIWITDYAWAVARQGEGFLAERRVPRTFLAKASTANLAPVVLLPGTREPWIMMRPLLRSLRRAGHPVHVLRMAEYGSGDILSASTSVGGYLARHDLRGAVIVAHGTSGLVGAYVLAHADPGRRVHKLIAIATRFTDERIHAPERMVSVFAAYDPHIGATSHVRGGHNIALRESGHFRILDTSELIDTIRQQAAL